MVITSKITSWTDCVQSGPDENFLQTDPKVFVDNCYFGLGVPIGTDAFIQHFVEKKCQEIMEDVDNL